MSIEPTILVRAVAVDELLGERRVAERGRADGRPRGTDAERAGDVLRGPQPAAHLDVCPAERLGDDPRRDLQLARLPCPRAVEVDDVEPGHADRREPARDGDRVAVVGGLAREVPLLEPHDLSAAQVDRGQQLERPCSVDMPSPVLLPF